MDTARNDELRVLIVDAQVDGRALLRQRLQGLPEIEFVFEEACSGEAKSRFHAKPSGLWW